MHQIIKQRQRMRFAWWMESGNGYIGLEKLNPDVILGNRAKSRNTGITNSEPCGKPNNSPDQVVVSQRFLCGPPP